MLTAASPAQVREYKKRGEHAMRHSLRSYLRAATGDDHAGLDARLSALDWGSVHDYRHSWKPAPPHCCRSRRP